MIFARTDAAFGVVSPMLIGRDAGVVERSRLLSG